MNIIEGWASRLAPMLVLALAVVMLPVSQARADEIYTRSARGVVTVAPDGAVNALEFEGDLGEAGAGVDALVRSWRFDPIMTTDGERVEHAVRVDMRVDLYATRQADGSFSVSTGRPKFVPVDDLEHDKRITGLERRSAAMYPEASARNGQEATVLVLVQVAPDGSVTRVGTRSAALLNQPPRGAELTAIRPFVREAHRAARGMRFVPSDKDLREFLLPVEFTFRGRDENRWSRIVFVPRAQEAWVEEGLARNARESRKVEELDASGQPIDTRIALATEIDDPWL